jgi:dihydropteroate synthase
MGNMPPCGSGRFSVAAAKVKGENRATVPTFRRMGGADVNEIRRHFKMNTVGTKPEPAPVRRPRIMGIVNVTPDSFSDGGRFAQRDAAAAQARQMEKAGADIIDIGGESTRPGYTPVDAQTELGRVLPVLDAILPALSVPVSIDTTKPIVAAEALRRGARMLNDQWALRRDPEMAVVAADADVEIVLMHNRETIDPDIDIIEDMLRYFETSLEIARRGGIRDERIILDPGIGFGKTVAQNLTCVTRLGVLRNLGFPVLLGVSRKSSIGHILDRPVGERLIGTVATNAWAMRDGVDIIRVHDVAEHVDLVRMFAALESAAHATGAHR